MDLLACVTCFKNVKRGLLSNLILKQQLLGEALEPMNLSKNDKKALSSQNMNNVLQLKF